MGLYKKLGVLALGALTILPLTGCASVNDSFRTNLVSTINVEDEATKGYLWEATKDGKTINLVGTIHPAPDNVNYFNPTLSGMVNESDVLAVEIDLTDKELNKDFIALQNERFILEDGTIEDYINTEQTEKLKECVDRFGFEYNDVKITNEEGMIINLMNGISAYLGYSGQSLDLALINQFDEQDKEVISLESNQVQVEVASANAKRYNLKELIMNLDDTYLENRSKATNEYFDAYKSGDLEFASEQEQIYRETLGDDVYDIIQTDRNIAMAEKINEFIKEDKKYTVAVGFMHFFGENSILKLLEKDGYKIKHIL